jgi:DNA modification methylase
MAAVIRADARALPLPDASVDLVVTSPPYFALRSYTDTCRICLDVQANGHDPRKVLVDYDAHVRKAHHYDGQIGAEPTPAAYVDSLIDCTREWVRALKPGGSIWVNLGDKYAQNVERSRNGNGSTALDGGIPLRTGPVYSERRDNGVRQKSLIGLPWRYALRCIDDLGLILRAEVIWSKPNGLPESVTDRVRRSHETWFHFVRQPRYYSAVDEIREPHSEHTLRYYGPGTTSTQRPANAKSNEVNPTQHRLTTVGGLGKLPGSVWEIATEPLTVPDHLGISHFAAFPSEWPRRIILGWSPSGICAECGEGRRPVTDGPRRSEVLADLPLCPSAESRLASRPRDADPHSDALSSGLGRPGWRKAGDLSKRITGEACACPDITAPTRPAVILDPFGGTGTTALVAKTLGRHGISVDRSADYCHLATWRTTDPGQLAKAMRVPKPPVEADGQLDLFTEIDAVPHLLAD